MQLFRKPLRELPRLAGVAALNLVVLVTGDFSSASGQHTTAPTPWDPGYLSLEKDPHQISLYFGYKVERGRLVFYHLADPQVPRVQEALGALRIDMVINERSRQSAFVASEDGKTLLYLHDHARFVPSYLKAKQQGLYQYVHGRGDTLVHAGAARVLSIYKLPPNAIRFIHPRYRRPPLDVGVQFVRTIEGDEYPEHLCGGGEVHRAAFLGDVQQVRKSVEAGADPNVPHLGGFTPLHDAANWGYEEVVKLLLDLGVDIHVRALARDSVCHSWNCPGCTPLQVAVSQYFNLPVVELLLARGADPNRTDEKGRTALHSAASGTPRIEIRICLPGR